ncbi:sensor histidine kinase [Nonomuraea sp. KM88]|uniref:sensor histidine kinase n=1 Tax=Nonomuraea sp. KM88 TaxID=3457427 RepID=UPI003FCD25CF
MAWVVAVAAADTALLWLAGTEGWVLAAFAAVTGLAMAVSPRRPLAAFLAALSLAVLTGGSYALLVCTGYQAGRRMSARRETIVAFAATVAHLGAILMIAQRTALAPEPFVVLARAGVLTALPVLAGRYLAQQREHQRRERELIAERERLRIARDMHDSLGHLLGLVSVQAAALEIAALPAEQRGAVRSLAGTARTAMAELHEVVGALRHADRPGVEGIDELVARAAAAGLAVTVERSGSAAPLAKPDAGHAAHRVVQEGLTNAARHAPGAPIRVSLDWQPDALLVSVANPAVTRTGQATPGGAGLAGLSERVRAAGGLLRVHAEPHEFRLVAMLPLAQDTVGAPA